MAPPVSAPERLIGSTEPSKAAKARLLDDEEVEELEEEERRKAEEAKRP